MDMSTTTIGIWLWIWLTAGPLVPGVFDDEPTIESLRTSIHTLIRDSNWKKASETIKAFKKLGRSSVTKEAKTLKLWIKARKSLVALQLEHIKEKAAPRHLLTRADALQKRYPIRELAEELSDFQIILRREIFTIIETFENSQAQEDTRLVKSSRPWGVQALRWNNPTMYESKWAVFPREKGDWSEIEALVFWCHASKPGQLFELRVWTHGGGAHLAHIKVRWTGWHEVRLPLRGKSSPFRTDPGATWSDVKSIQFYKDEGTQIDVTIDDIMIEKKWPRAKKKSNGKNS